MPTTPNRALWYPTHARQAAAADLQRLAFTADSAVGASSTLLSSAQRRPRASMVRTSGSVSVAKATATFITFVTELYDSANMVNLGTFADRMTVPTTGLYAVSAKLLYSTVGAAVYDPLTVAISRNLSNVAQTGAWTKKVPFTGSAAQWVSGSGVLSCTAGDTISVFAFWTSAAVGPWSVTGGQLTAWLISTP